MVREAQEGPRIVLPVESLGAAARDHEKGKPSMVRAPEAHVRAVRSKARSLVAEEASADPCRPRQAEVTLSEIPARWSLHAMSLQPVQCHQGRPHDMALEAHAAMGADLRPVQDFPALVPADFSGLGGLAWRERYSSTAFLTTQPFDRSSVSACFSTQSKSSPGSTAFSVFDLDFSAISCHRLP